MLRGDELGVIFGEAIARTAKRGTFANSIVSSSALKKIAHHYSLDFKETLTGFKWLAKIDNLTFGYEEAIGYCVDSKTVNDKDGISAALYLAQIASDLAQEDKTLQDLLNEVWKRDGFHATEQISIRFTDLSKMDLILADLRANAPKEISGLLVESIDDLAKPSNDLPPTEGIRIWLAGGIRVIIRPSGTEPKMKCYIEVIAADEKRAQSQLEVLRGPLRKLLSRD
jgi:phosphomannomutase